MVVCFINTALSRSSAHGRLQFKFQKLRVGGYTEELVLKWFNYPRIRAHPRCKISYQGVPNRLASSLCLCFVEASPTMEKAVPCYIADRLTALLPSFHSIRSSLAVCKFHAAGEERCEQGHRQVCAWTFDTWCRGAQSAPEQLQLCELSGPTFWIHYARI